MTKVKLNGPARTWSAELVGSTHAGAWLFAAAGTPVRHEEPAGYVSHYESAGVQLLEPGQWWTAWWWADARRITIDITRPVTANQHGYRYVDLKLDLWWRDGNCGIVDQDDLQAALEAGDLDQATADVAQQVADDLHVRLHEDHEFVRSGFALLDRMLTPRPNLD